MKYKEFSSLKILAEKKGKIYLYSEIKDNFDKYFLWCLYTIIFFFLMILASLPFYKTIDTYDMLGILLCSIILSIILAKKYLNFMIKENSEKNISMIKENQDLKKRFVKKFINKKQEKEKVYIAIDNLFSNLIKQKIIKDNVEEFKLSKKEFYKMLSKQLKYDKKLLKRIKNEK